MHMSLIPLGIGKSMYVCNGLCKCLHVCMCVCACLCVFWAEQSGLEKNEGYMVHEHASVLFSKRTYIYIHKRLQLRVQIGVY